MEGGDPSTTGVSSELTILGKGGLGLKGGNKERQLSPDKERDKT